MADRRGRKVVKPVAAAAVTLGTIASIWWFALKPRRKLKNQQTGTGGGPDPGAGFADGPAGDPERPPD